MGWFDGNSLRPLQCKTAQLTPVFTDDSEEARHYNDFQNTPQHEHEAKFSHELIGGAAAFEAMKSYEDHEARNGTFTMPLQMERTIR
jgi:hypothetical protein